MTTNARAVANEFIRLANESNRAFTPLQLIKLVYIAHGWMLGIHQRPLIRDRIEAWQYGPVIPNLYHDLKSYGSAHVRTPLSSFSSLFASSIAMDDEEKELVLGVFKGYGRMNGIQLSSLTHRPGTPWHDTWVPGSRGLVISNDLIAEHYRRLARERGIITE